MTARAPVEPLCPGCGYSLRGLPVGPCPECGRWVDPQNPGLPDGAAFWHALATFAPHRAVNAVYAALVAGLFLLLCSPTGDFSEDWLALVILVVMGTLVSWLPLFAMHLAGRAGVWMKKVRQPRWRWGWVVVPAVLVGSLAVQQSGWVWRARWWVSRDGFAALAAAGPAVPTCPGRIGVFYVSEAEHRPDGTIWCRLSFPDVYSDGPARLVYSPGVAPWAAPIVTDVGGGWWALVDHT